MVSFNGTLGLSALLGVRDMASIMLDVNGLDRWSGYIMCTYVYPFTYTFMICLPIKVIQIKYKPTCDSIACTYFKMGFMV